MQKKNSGHFFRVTDPIQIYQINYWIYVFTGFWNYKSNSKRKEILFKTYQFVIATVYAGMLCLFCIDAVTVRQELDKLSFNMTSSVLVLITFSKITMLWGRRVSVENVLKNLDDNLNMKTTGEWKEYQEIFKGRATLILQLSKLLYGMLVVCYSLRVLVDTALDTKAFLIPFPFMEKLEDHYEIIYTQQVIVISHFLIVVISHDLLIYSIINRLIAHFEILERNFLRVKTLHPRINFEEHVRGYREQTTGCNDRFLLKIFANEIGDSYKQKMRKESDEMEKAKLSKEILTETIQHHQKLLRHVRQIINFAKIYNRPFLVQVFGTILLIGIVSINILFLSRKISPRLVQQVMYVGITLLNNFHLCSYATELSTKSLSVANALYDTPWYEMDVHNRRIIHFTLKNFMVEPKLRGGSLIVINRKTYLKMLQTSYNLAVVFRNIY